VTGKSAPPERRRRRYKIAAAIVAAAIALLLAWQATQVEFVAWATPSSPAEETPSGRAAPVTLVSPFRARGGWEAICDQDYCRDAILAMETVPAAPNTSYVVTATLTLDHRVSAGDAGLASAAVKADGAELPALLAPGAYRLSSRSVTSTTLQWSRRVTTGPQGEVSVEVGASARDRTSDGYARLRGSRGVLKVELTED
jgi:hypothetical protein